MLIQKHIKNLFISSLVVSAPLLASEHWKRIRQKDEMRKQLHEFIIDGITKENYHELDYIMSGISDFKKTGILTLKDWVKIKNNRNVEEKLRYLHDNIDTIKAEKEKTNFTNVMPNVLTTGLVSSALVAAPLLLFRKKLPTSCNPAHVIPLVFGVSSGFPMYKYGTHRYSLHAKEQTLDRVTRIDSIINNNSEQKN